MSKVTLTDLVNLQNETTAVNAINANNAAIEAAMDNTLSRDGTAPNQMSSTLDMNSNHLINLPQPVSGSEPLRLQDAATLNGAGTISSIPTGGTTNQVLQKNSNTNFDTKWSTLTGTVTSVGLSMPADYTITNSPVTGVGTLTANYAVAPTGTGAFVKATSPTLVTPTIGVATATSVNGQTITAGAGTLTLGSNTLTAANTGTAVTSATAGGGDLTGTYPSPTIQTGVVSNAKLAIASASTIKGNVTTGAASPTDFTIGSLTQKVSPAGTDLLLLQDQAAGGALKYVTVSGVSAGGAVSTVNGQTGSVTLPTPPQGRITYTSLTPVLSTNTTGATVIYYTPYNGNTVLLFDGTFMIPTVFTELSQLSTDATKSPAAVAASKMYDIFVWNDGGTIRATRGPAWTNDSTRGYTLTMQNGILLNTSSITNGPAASRGTYVGTVRSNGSSTFDYILSGAASGGSQCFLGLWNTYNRTDSCASVTDNGTSYTYSSATIRQARASSGNQILYVSGLSEDCMSYSYSGRITTTAAASSFMFNGVGFNSTTTFLAPQASTVTTSTTAVDAYFTCAGSVTPVLGLQILSANEQGDGTHANTVNSGTVLSMRFRN